MSTTCSERAAVAASGRPELIPPFGWDELPPTVRLAGLEIAPLTQAELVCTLLQRAKQARKTRVHYVNAHVLNLSRRDPDFRRVLSACDLLYADGASIVWAARRLGGFLPERLTAADYFEPFCRRCAAESLSLFLLGSAAGVAEIAAARLERAVPGLRVVGASAGYLSPRQSRQVVERVNRSGAQIMVVGMSSPIQERWLAEYGSRISASVQWAVGALLDYHAGFEPRAPRWVCRCGGEWLFRLVVRPRQRWRRYLLGNTRFAGWLARQWLIPGRPAESPEYRSLTAKVHLRGALNGSGGHPSGGLDVAGIGRS